jgi:hypothetical protein
MDDPGDLRSKVKQALVSLGAWGGTAAAGAILATPDHVNVNQVALAAGLSGLAAVAEKLPDLYRAASMRNWFRVLFGFARPAELEADVEQKLNAAVLDANGQAVLFDVLRKMNDATDPAALVPIGRLLREYVDEKRSIDSFFRGVVRTLLDVTASEIASLTIILRALRDSKNTAPFVDIQVKRLSEDHFDFSEAADGDQLRIPLRPQTQPDGYEFEAVRNPLGHSRRIFHLLLAHGIAIDPAITGSEPAVAMEKATAGRFLALLED